MKAEDLIEGDVSQTEGNGSLKITKIHVDVRGEEVYNFEVEEDHNYYVSKAGVLVHNEGYDPIKQQEARRGMGLHILGTVAPILGLSAGDLAGDALEDVLEEIAEKGLEDPRVRKNILKKLARAGADSESLKVLNSAASNAGDLLTIYDSLAGAIRSGDLVLDFYSSAQDIEEMRKQHYLELEETEQQRLDRALASNIEGITAKNKDISQLGLEIQAAETLRLEAMTRIIRLDFSAIDQYRKQDRVIKGLEDSQSLAQEQIEMHRENIASIDKSQQFLNEIKTMTVDNKAKAFPQYALQIGQNSTNKESGYGYGLLMLQGIQAMQQTRVAMYAWNVKLSYDNAIKGIPTPILGSVLEHAYQRYGMAQSGADLIVKLKRYDELRKAYLEQPHAYRYIGPVQ